MYFYAGTWPQGPGHLSRHSMQQTLSMRVSGEKLSLANAVKHDRCLSSILHVGDVRILFTVLVKTQQFPNLFLSASPFPFHI